MWVIFHLIYSIYYLALVKCEADSDIGEVVFANILFRHGDRTIVEPYPNDPYKNSSKWPDGWGQLTKRGKYGQYLLGTWLRKRYERLLPVIYNPDDIHIQSTDVDRTLMSAYCNLAGLYEPSSRSNWNHHIRWTPIPVHTVPEHLDWILAAKAPCPKYDRELRELYQSPEFQKINQDNKELYDYLTKHTGENITDFIGAERIYDTIFIENLNDLPLPIWTRKIFPEPLKSIAAFSFSVPCYTPSLARLKSGPLLGVILKNMEEKISKKSKKKVHVFSGHDTTIANTLKALDLFEPHCPPYYSSILFELRKKNEDFFVTIIYKNTSSVSPYVMQLKGCDKLCPFEKFQSIVSSIVPSNWEEECQNIRFVENFFDTTASISLFTIVSLGFIFLLSLGIAVKFYKNQQRNQSDFVYKSLKSDIAS